MVDEKQYRQRTVRRVGVIALKVTMAILWLCLVFTRPAAAEPDLVIGSIFMQPLSNQQQTGMLDVIVRNVFASLDMEVLIVPLPGERSLLSADSGLTDGDILRIAGLERLYPNLIQVPEKLMDFYFMAFTRRPDILIKDWDSLKPHSVGIVTGWKILEQNIHSHPRTDVETPELLFTLLGKERAEIVVYERYEGEYIAKKLGLDDVRTLFPPLAVREMFLYLNKRHTNLVPEVVRVLKEMKNSGEYARIVEKALGTSAPRTMP